MTASKAARAVPVTRWKYSRMTPCSRTLSPLKETSARLLRVSRSFSASNWSSPPGGLPQVGDLLQGHVGVPGKYRKLGQALPARRGQEAYAGVDRRRDRH